jgi:formylglycine-generating enzyme required for sulfatase activity
MGSRDGDEDAVPSELGNPENLRIDYPFWISPYPVTVAQLGCFVESGGYEDSQWWTDPGWDWRSGRYDSQVKEDWLKDWLSRRPPELRAAPHLWNEQKIDTNRPVTGVSWFEAMAYARWLDAQVRGQSEGIPSGYVLRLPTEAEWEKAARGAGGRRYAWGDTWEPALANVESEVGRPSAIGMCPGGATPSGAHDLTGNVWEWCLSLHRPYPYQFGDGRNEPETDGDRVVRGGSWLIVLRNSRCAYRLRNRPDSFNDLLGFRVVLSLADSEF